MDTPQVLLDHHLKTLRLPTFLREYDKVAQQCAAEGVDFPRYLLRLAELELLDRERRATERRIHQAKFDVVKSLAPDDRRIAFSVEYGADNAGIAVAPYHDGVRIEPADWIAITDGREFDGLARWAPDGNRIYFVSDRDGFRCIWTNALDPTSKRPLGTPAPVAHFHEAQRSMLNIPIGSLGLAVGTNQLLFNLGEYLAYPLPAADTSSRSFLANPRLSRSPHAKACILRACPDLIRGKAESVFPAPVRLSIRPSFYKRLLMNGAKIVTWMAMVCPTAADGGLRL
jgi:WD40-like Beta Propeller Repeat